MSRSFKNNRSIGGVPNNTAVRNMKASATSAAQRRALLTGNKSTIAGFKSQTQFQQTNLEYVPLVEDCSFMDSIPAMLKEAISMIFMFRLMISHTNVRQRRGPSLRVQNLMMISPLEAVWSFFFSPKQTSLLLEQLQAENTCPQLIDALKESESSRLELFDRNITRITTKTLCDRREQAQRKIVERETLSEEESKTIKKMIPDCKRDVTMFLDAKGSTKQYLSDADEIGSFEPKFEFVFSSVGNQERFEMINGVEYRISTSYSLGSLGCNVLIPFRNILAGAFANTLSFLATDLTQFRSVHKLTAKVPPFALQKMLMVIGTIVNVPINWCELTASTMENVLDDNQYFSELIEASELSEFGPHCGTFTWRLAQSKLAYYVSEQMVLTFKNGEMVQSVRRYLGANQIDSRKFVTTSRAMRVVPAALTNLRTQLHKSFSNNAGLSNLTSTLSQSMVELNKPDTSQFEDEAACLNLIATDATRAKSLFFQESESPLKQAMLGAHLIYEGLIELKHSSWAREISELTNDLKLQKILAVLFSSAMNTQLSILSEDDLDSIPDTVLESLKGMDDLGMDVHSHYVHLMADSN